ncbi:MAG: class I SAM-dependent methyltransferase [Thermodesulfobacteriota bacterium]
MTRNRTFSIDILRPDFWEESWRRIRAGSFLKASQENHPERWAAFYDRVGDIYADMMPDHWDLGLALAEYFFREEIVRPGDRVLDVGCGSGCLSLPLARGGAKVTALDKSAGMLAALTETAQNHSAAGIETRCLAWQNFPAVRNYDLAVAAFFPPALDPEGLMRLETFSRRYCALVLGAGGGTPPIHRRIWEEFLAPCLQPGRVHVVQTLGYLLAVDRRPNLKHLFRPYTFRQPLDKVVNFYREYLALFGLGGPGLAQEIETVLAPFSRNGQVEAEGAWDVCLIWWARPGEADGKAERS